MNIARLDKELNEKHKIVQGVLRTSAISDVSGNQNALNKLPFKFNYNVGEGIEIAASDQKDSGRCWIFAALNVIRRKMIAKHKLSSDFQLSQAWIYRWDKFEKCNTILELCYKFADKKDSLEIVNLVPGILGDGGTWPQFVAVIRKYGVVPAEVYPDNNQVSHTGSLNQLLYKIVMKACLRVNAGMKRSVFDKLKAHVLVQCYRVINICMGNNVKKFNWTWSGKDAERAYTPVTFYKQLIKPVVNVENYVSICNDPRHEYGSVLKVEHLANIYEAGVYTNTYVNLNIADFKKAVFETIKNDVSVWFACDIGQYLLNNKTVLDTNASNLEDMFDIDFLDSKRNMMLSRCCVPNHAMCLVGCQYDSGVFRRWKVENSHGDSGALKGFMTMSDKWFDNFVVCCAVPAEFVARHAGKEIILPFWDILGTFAS